MMKAAQLRAGAGRANSWLLGLLAFALPLSTSAVSVLAILIFLLWLLEGNFLEKAVEIFFHPVAAALLGFLGLLTLGLLWSKELGAGLEVLRNSWKLALLPVFMTVVRHEHRSLYLHSFAAGMGTAMLITFLVWLNLLQYADVSPTHLTPKTFHVVYNPLLAFAAYLVLHEAIWGGRSKAARIGLFSLAGLMSVNMFMTEGRTGQTVFLVLMALLLLQLFAGSKLRAAAAVLLLLPTICIISYFASPVFRQRTETAWDEICCFDKNPNTSVGMRMQFVLNALALVQRHPCFGVGTGDFQTAYAAINRKQSPRCVATDNPHNQYMLAAVMLGLPGLLSLLLIFAAMFVQAWLLPDELRRIRVAFPLFFLVIMLAESYLRVYQTAFFFSLAAAVLYKRKPDAWLLEAQAAGKRCWLILSYRANIPGSACSQHLDDRLPFFRAQGIEPVLLTSPVGEQAAEWIHCRTISLAPSGIRFELRHFLRKHLRRRWQFKTAETLILLPIWPLYLLEKMFINLESEWSWCVLAGLRGFLLCRQLRPEVLYSTGGSASAHVAALFIKRCTGIAWIAETQDPLVHDQGWRRSKAVLRLYKLLEKKICLHADVFVFLVQAAMEHCRKRTGGCCRMAFVYPGSAPSLFQEQSYAKGSRCSFAHFGSLSGTRNLIIFFQALQQVLAADPALRDQVQVDVYGSFDSGSEEEMKRLHFQDMVRCHGPVPRQQAIAAMQQADCLLLIQNIIYFSCETVPSKVYEYLFSGRPILGLLHNNRELEAMLTENGHLAVPADDVQAVAAAINTMLAQFSSEQGMPSKAATKAWTTAEAVEELIQLSECSNLNLRAAIA